MGYSKLLRYVILVVPPSILLFSLLLDETVRTMRAPRTSALFKQIAFVAVCLCAAALCLEIAAGVGASWSIQNDLIKPIVGEAY